MKKGVLMPHDKNMRRYNVTAILIVILAIVIVSGIWIVYTQKCKDLDERMFLMK